VIAGEYKYIQGWYAVFVNEKKLIVRVGPFNTQDEAKAEREKQTGVKHEG